MDGDCGDLAEIVEKHGKHTDYDFPPPFTNKFVVRKIISQNEEHVWSSNKQGMLNIKTRDKSPHTGKLV